MIYEYRCTGCRIATHETMTREQAITHYCAICFERTIFKRLFSFSYKPGMHDHFNHAVGKGISSMQQFKDELTRKGDEIYTTTGIETNYKPIDMGDAAAVGATSEGIHESNIERSKRGVPLLPEIG